MPNKVDIFWYTFTSILHANFHALQAAKKRLVTRGQREKGRYKSSHHPLPRVGGE